MITKIAELLKLSWKYDKGIDAFFNAVKKKKATKKAIQEIKKLPTNEQEFAYNGRSIMLGGIPRKSLDKALANSAADGATKWSSPTMEIVEPYHFTDSKPEHCDVVKAVIDLPHVIHVGKRRMGINLSQAKRDKNPKAFVSQEQLDSAIRSIFGSADGDMFRATTLPNGRILFGSSEPDKFGKYWGAVGDIRRLKNGGTPREILTLNTIMPMSKTKVQRIYSPRLSTELKPVD